ncbi:hypothetical protein D3C80_1501760 [compost metagenome]
MLPLDGVGGDPLDLAVQVSDGLVEVFHFEGERVEARLVLQVHRSAALHRCGAGGVEQVQGNVAHLDGSPLLLGHVGQEEAQAERAMVEIDQALHVVAEDVHVVEAFELEHGFGSRWLC